ncbi:putative regulator of chromosome condensation 1/beta-lactamase-inhibitor protein II [Helianthus debilis subsp. tardiflorus]
MEGEVQIWGRNQNGQLGLGTTEDSHVPQKIEAFQGINVKMVVAGAERTMAITEGGELYRWGWWRYGNLGLGDRNDRNIPEKAPVISVFSYFVYRPSLYNHQTCCYIWIMCYLKT